ncbi:MAG: hypothetical protein HYY78_03570 [Betaproteobacteria bacterium]|nr:hypothetical protein [Betaproteobacteria bacterium]
MRNSDIKELRPGTPTTTLAPGIESGVGRVVVLWSYIEAVLKATIFNLLGVGSREGRHAVREPRIKDSVLLIKTLLEINNIEIKGNLEKLATGLDDLAAMRNSLVHGVWIVIDGVTYLQVTTGKWTPPGHKGKVSRKINPQGSIISIEDLALLVEAMELSAGAVEGLGHRVFDALQASPRKSLKLIPVFDLHRSRSLEKSKPPHQSSPA